MLKQMSSRLVKTTFTGVGSEIPAVDHARSVSEMTQCPSGFALPSSYAAIEVKRRVLKVLVAFPPVWGLAESRPTSRRVVAVRRTTGVLVQIFWPHWVPHGTGGVASIPVGPVEAVE